MAKTVKEIMDKKYGPSWHCIIGSNFSFEVTYQVLQYTAPPGSCVRVLTSDGNTFADEDAATHVFQRGRRAALQAMRTAGGGMQHGCRRFSERLLNGPRHLNCMRQNSKVVPERPPPRFVDSFLR